MGTIQTTALTAVAAALFAAAAGAETVNKKCPISGKNVKPGKSLTFEGAEVGFCCSRCIARFEKNPSRYKDRIQGLKSRARTASGGRATNGTVASKTGSGTAAGGAPCNTKCPISGKAVDPGATFAFQGRTVGFCCNKCRTKFAAQPARYVAKVKANVPVNSKCPFSGKAVDTSETFAFQGTTVGFCCGKCAGKFAKSAAASIGKVVADKLSVANTKCPMSGKAVDASKTSLFQGRKIGFCCGKCKAKFDRNPAAYFGKVKLNASLPTGSKKKVA